MRAGRRSDLDGFAFVSIAKDLAGWVRKDLPPSLFVEFARDPEAFFNEGSARVLKDGVKTKVIQATLRNRNGASREVVIKRFHYDSLPRRLGTYGLRSPAQRCLEGALLLGRNGFHTPAPLAVFESRNLKQRGTSYYISEELRQCHSIQGLWDTIMPTLSTTKRLRLSRSIFRDLARLLSSLHSKRIYHRDLKGSNILIQNWESEQRKFCFVDLDRVGERRLLRLAKRIENLLQVKRGAWSVKERIYFYRRYAELVYPSGEKAKELVRRILAIHQRSRAQVDGRRYYQRLS